MVIFFCGKIFSCAVWVVCLPQIFLYTQFSELYSARYKERYVFLRIATKLKCSAAIGDR